MNRKSLGTRKPKRRSIFSKNRKIKLLLLTTNSSNAAWLQLEREQHYIEYGLVTAKCRSKFKIFKFSGARIEDIRFALSNYAPHYIHFSGNGNINEALPAATRALALSAVKCIFLNASFSIAQAKEIATYGGKVVYMNKGISNDMAIYFAVKFYAGIFTDETIERSFASAMNPLGFDSRKEGNKPRLLP